MRIQKIAFALLIILALLAVTGCDIPVDFEHECVYTEDYRVESTCKEKGKVIYSCFCGETKTEELPLGSHTIVDIPPQDATCTEEGRKGGKGCAVCGTVTVEPDTVECIPHTEVIDEARPAEGGKPAMTEGKHCSVCGLVTVRQEYIFADGFENPNSYDGNYGYNYLSSLPNGESLTAFYDRLDLEVDYFHSSGEDAPEDNVVSKITYSDLGLTKDEAVAVWSAYRMDRPLYYWISNQISHTSTYMHLITSPEYASGSERNLINSNIYSAAERYMSQITDFDPYSLSLAFHDIIIEEADYAYESDGVTPEDAVWAHNVTGTLLFGSGVCESYAKAFQLLLNYCGVENIFVKGYAGEPHAWNLVEIEDGEWYWFDLTWDDDPDFMWGTLYNYFCVTDNENTGWRDGSWSVPASTFVGKHTAEPPINTGIDFMYPLPERSSTPYDGILRDTFTVSGLTYAVSGHGDAALVWIDKSGAVTIPETVTYMGNTYTVKVIGKIENGVFKDGAVSDRAVTSISVPASVEYIFGGALSIENISGVSVSADSEHFSYSDGILYDKDKTYIHALVDRNITTLHIGAGVTGWNNGGTAFYNCLKLSSVTVDAENPYFASYGGVLYNKDKTEIKIIPRAISGALVLADTLTSIGSSSANESFEYHERLESLYIPRSVTSFSETFGNCPNLDVIYYEGTESEWRALTGGKSFGITVYFNYSL